MLGNLVGKNNQSESFDPRSNESDLLILGSTINRERNDDISDYPASSSSSSINKVDDGNDDNLNTNEESLIIQVMKKRSKDDDDFSDTYSSSSGSSGSDDSDIGNRYKKSNASASPYKKRGREIESLNLSSGNKNTSTISRRKTGKDDSELYAYTKRNIRAEKQRKYSNFDDESEKYHGYQIFPDAHKVGESFITEENSVINSAEYLDTTFPGKSFDDWIMRETTEIYAYGIMFKLALIEMFSLVACIIISVLVYTTIIDISSKVYLIVGSIVFGVLLIFIHLPTLIIYWSTNNNVNHVHINAISTSYLVAIASNILAWVGIGFWQRDYADKWELDSEIYDDPFDPEIFNRLLNSHAMLAALFTFSLTLYFNTLWAHMHPEIVVNRDDNVIIKGQIKKVNPKNSK